MGEGEVKDSIGGSADRSWQCVSAGLLAIGEPTKFRRLMLVRFSQIAAVCLLLGACAPEIGDDCTTSADCATTDQSRLCLSQVTEGFPGGYCTVFNCQPGSCPSESVCVGFRTSLANSPECDQTSGRARLQRTYCMRTCNADKDCRSGYACIDVGEDDPWGAVVLEEGKRANRTKICTVAYSEPESSPDRSSDVCSWELPSGEPPVVTGGDAGSSSQGAPSSQGATPDGGMGVADAATSAVDASSSDASHLSQSEGGTASVDMDASPPPLLFPVDSGVGFPEAGASPAAQDAAAEAGP